MRSDQEGIEERGFTYSSSSSCISSHCHMDKAICVKQMVKS